MRVLAIRGKNLTSLAGDFEVDFEIEPLASAGIFAITGPTGAGKSTLLDAVCLALFNHVPRLVSAARGQVGAAGGETISADDPRALLRHRAVEGYAEVDFVGLDGGRYRARWYVKRARLRSDGGLQQVVQTFTNLESGEVFGGTRTETLLAIRNKIGLTAQQFGRAVMLAQGEFNAFIDADSNTRAELLEKLTGTELYARLGIAARQKSDGLRNAQAEIELRITAQNGLDDIRRTEAEERHTEARREYEAAKAVLAAREKDREWHTLEAALAARVQLAEQMRAAANTTKSEAGPRRAELAARRLAYSIVPAWRATSDADAKVTTTVLRIGVLKDQSDAAHLQVETATVQDTEAAETLAVAEQELERQRPELESARALDRQLAELDEALAPLTEARITAKGVVEEIAARHADAVAKRNEAIERRIALVDWLDCNRAQESLAIRRDDLAADIGEHVQLATKAAGLQSALNALAKRLSEARVSLSKAETTAIAARAALDEAERQCTTARAGVPPPEVAAGVELERDQLTAIEPCLLAFERSKSDLERLGGVIETDKAEKARLDAELADLEARRVEIDALLPGLNARHDEAIRAGALSAAASGDAAEQLRAALVFGEPCPVCGGTDHAVETLAGLIDGRAATDAGRISELANEIAACDMERAVLIDRLTQDGIRRTAASARIANGVSLISDATEQCASALASLEAALLTCGVAMNASSQRLRSEISTKLVAVDDRRRQVAVARKAEQQAMVALNDERLASAKADDIERVAEQSVRDLHAESELCGNRLGESLRRCDQVALVLDGSLLAYFDWRADEAAVETLDRVVAAWRERAQGLAVINTELPGLTNAAHDAESELGREAVRLDGAINAERTCQQEQQRLAANRALVLGGEAVETVAERLSEAVMTASKHREGIRSIWDSARSAAAAAEGRHQQAVSSLSDAEADATALRQSLNVELAVKQVDVDLVASVASRGEAALDTEALALAKIDQIAAVAGAEWQSRLGDWEAHLDTQKPLVARDALEDALRGAGLAETTARKALDDNELVIRQDDRVRQATAELRLVLEQERAAALRWLQLDVLIGDATGNKFRRYAQGLTLERLLLHANARLGELKPRYSLERAPGGDMLVQVVDHDMAGEVRGLPNLSGGERFLVSLALALGLSEMSTGQGLRVESLFIDEGFGALDSASLGQAISVLEQLHATGRRVGVISHIEDVKERIAVKITVAPASNGRSAIAVRGS